MDDGMHKLKFFDPRQDAWGSISFTEDGRLEIDCQGLDGDEATRRMAESLAHHYSFLHRDQAEEIERLRHRVQDLLEANNRYQQDARDLRAAARNDFQARVRPWMLSCFGEEISSDRIERNHRFLEESLELVQSTGCSPSEAHQLVDYVFGRAPGDTRQEIGGVMVTLAALCLAIGEDMSPAGEAELARVWTKIDKIRAKQAAKPKHSPLPEVVSNSETANEFDPDEGSDAR